MNQRKSTWLLWRTGIRCFKDSNIAEAKKLYDHLGCLVNVAKLNSKPVFDENQGLREKMAVIVHRVLNYRYSSETLSEISWRDAWGITGHSLWKKRRQNYFYLVLAKGEYNNTANGSFGTPVPGSKIIHEMEALKNDVEAAQAALIKTKLVFPPLVWNQHERVYHCTLSSPGQG